MKRLLCALAITLALGIGYADAEKIFVGANDDMYRDAAGKIWKLK